jgi:CheY-like chemotaxis protein
VGSPRPSTARPADADLSGLRIVIVDDDPDALELMRTILAQCGADVATAGSAIEAFDVLQQGRPDVLISDIGMPDADGYALLRKVRAPDTGERGMVPAIAVTGRTSPGDRQRALSAGYQLHLTKPLDAGQLIAGVAHLVGRG